jgi:rod shape-determining protein MreC
MKKNGFIVLLAVLAAMACMALAVQQRMRFPLVDRVVVTVVEPFNRLALAMHDQLAGLKEDSRTKASLQEENEKLHKELDGLRNLEYRLENLEAENALLNQMVGYKQQHTGQKLLPARIIGTGLGDLHDAYLVDKGAQDGVKQDMLIVAGEGLAGVVEEVYPTSCRMLLLSSSRMRMGARVTRAASRTVGVVTGSSLPEAPLKMEYLPREADIKEGDTIITSGFGGKYPAGIYIGRVTKIQFDSAGLLKLALIEAASKLDSLEKVYVVLEVQEGLQTEPAAAAGKAGAGAGGAAAGGQAGPAAAARQAGPAAVPEVPQVSDAGKEAQP